MIEKAQVEKSVFAGRIELLIQMLDEAIQRPGSDGCTEFVSVAIDTLRKKFPQSASFYANAERMRKESQDATKNEFVDPFVLAARIGFAYAFVVVREWQDMTCKCESEFISQGPQDAACSGR